MSIVSGIIVTPNSISMVLDSQPYNITTGHVNFHAIRQAIKDKNVQLLADLVDVSVSIERSTKGLVTVRKDKVYYKGEEVHNAINSRILASLEEGFDIKPMLNFLENVFQNPSKTAIQELYLFLESGDLPITEDGYFLAYKRVSDDYMDIHSGTYCNKIGKTLMMDRSLVDPDRYQTCSAGLHFCSLRYLSSFHNGTGRVMILKIHPADVVAIPADYGNSKGRTWKYTVIGEVENPQLAFTSTVDTTWNTPIFWENPGDDENDSIYVAEDEEYDDSRPTYTSPSPQVFKWYKCDGSGVSYRDAAGKYIKKIEYESFPVELRQEIMY